MGPTPPKVIDHGISGKAEEPRLKRDPTLPVAGKRLDHLHEGPLHQIFRVGAIADAEESEPVDAAGEAVVELRERCAIAVPSPLDECLDVLFMVGHATASVPAASRPPRYGLPG
jgi:hypothetical protein